MSEASQPAQTPAQQLGLEDGQFLVKRGSGDIETGWRIEATGPGTFHDAPDTVVDVAKLLPVGENPGGMSKYVSVEELRSWQPTPEDDGLDADTVPREQVQTLGASVVEQVAVVDDSDTGTSSGTHIKGSEAAMSAEPTEAAADEPHADRVADEEAVIEPEPEQRFQPKASVVSEIAERLGMSEESDPVQVERTLREQLTEMDRMFGALNDFVPVSKTAVREIRDTLGSGNNRLTGRSRHDLDAFINSAPYEALRRLANDDRQLATMPAPIRGILQDMRGQIVHFGPQVHDMMGGNMRRGLVGAFDPGPAEPVVRTLGRVEELAQRAAQSRVQVERELTEIIGGKQADEEYAARLAEKQPKQDVFGILKQAERTETKALRVDGELREQLATALGDIVVEPLTDEQLAEKVRAARELVNNGEAANRLRSMRFEALPEDWANDVSDREKAVWLDEPIYIDPSAINSAQGFKSWMGRGSEGTGMVQTREAGTMGTQRQSLDQILDYATRETPLPELGADGGLQVVLANNGKFVVSHNAHRAAAAKLRGEPVPVVALDISRYDGEL